MYHLLQLPEDEYKTIILNTSSKKGMNTAIVEKDYWVCIILDYLFHHSKWKKHLAFKGGTCLSKAYHLIERFSEDIDLILDWRILGYEINEPWQERSNTKQLKFIKESKYRLSTFLENEFIPELKKGLSQKVYKKCDIIFDKDDNYSVLVAYPSIYDDPSILKVIKLEIGILGVWIPLQKCIVRSFIAEEYPNIFIYSDIALLATTPERTFWEKISILHQESYRPEYSIIPDRYSRHYYDVYCMVKKGVKDKAIKKIKMLEEVTNFNNKFYPRSWAKVDLAKASSIKLLPAPHSEKILKDDYEKMKSMFYGDYPTFEQILKTIKLLEEEINIAYKH